MEARSAFVQSVVCLPVGRSGGLRVAARRPGVSRVQRRGLAKLRAQSDAVERDENTLWTWAMRGIGGAAVAAAVLGHAATGYAEVPATMPATPVYDDAGVVPKGQRGYLDTGFAKLKETTGYDVHFITVRSFPYDETPEEYAQEIFDQWGLGPKDVVVVGGTKIARAGLAAGSDAKVLLTAEIMDSIGNRTFEKKAVENAFGSAALDVMNRMIPILNGKEDPGPPAQELDFAASTFKSKEETANQRGKYTKIVAFLLVVAFVVPMLQYWWYVK
eukprot:CAMPEP_0198313668 /NCGR_PEP_ID=MMETSP1450-20131203/4611_1 /TAXON_ID=753684 ORGANISM="Madagascaria erythrocladiodes, Strain CCMP3234" /NCGR_SAMPLE_ID=MMETSP1450 /ASSEMBLY_ACC=CAM_ASM_001115 /LENGTH=272 /DNA_ID=CAMNT_0044016677 /DNA_START=6 /DNA_END=824 /DNA_ORIENTATION=+